MRNKLLGAFAAVIIFVPTVGHSSDDTTGVEPGVLRIGVHAPATGASPIDVQAFSAGLEMYWSYLHDDLGLLVNGRRVEVTFADDQYKPTTAVAVCNEMAESSFLLVGFQGTDQINACAGFASQRGIPYIALGHQGDTYSRYATAFALSTPWERQSLIIAEYIANVVGAHADRYGRQPYRVPVLGLPLPVLTQAGRDGVVRVGLLRSNVPNHDGLNTSLKTALEAQGLDLRTYTVVREGNTSEASTLASRMRADDIDVVVLSTAPTFTTQLLVNMGRDNYRPLVLMYGMTSGLNAVAAIACPSGGIDCASVFSAWPGWRDVEDGAFDPSFSAAANTYAPDFNDEMSGDILLATWGLMKQIHAILDAAGRDLTRQSFVEMLDAGYDQTTGVYPSLHVHAADHLGANEVHRLEVDCDFDPTFRERDAFVTGYPAAT